MLNLHSPGGDSSLTCGRESSETSREINVRNRTKLDTAKVCPDKRQNPG